MNGAMTDEPDVSYDSLLDRVWRLLDAAAAVLQVKPVAAVCRVDAPEHNDRAAIKEDR